MESSIKFNPDLESEGGKLYRQYCEEKGIDYSITAGANFCLGYMAVKPNRGVVWVKASERLPGWKKRVKWRDGNNHSYATDGEISLFEMEKPNLEGWEWLDESAAGWEDAVSKEVLEFIRDIAYNWDCDEDSHKYNTICRKCSASELYYELTKQQKEK